MNSSMSYASLPVSSVNPSKIGAGTTDIFDSAWRPLQWLDRPETVRMQQLENEAVLWTLLETVPMMPAKTIMTHPAILWRVDNRLPMFTKLTADLASDGTSMTVEEPLLFKVGYKAILPRTNQQVLVTAVNNTSGVVTIDRSSLPGDAYAAVAGDEVRIGLPMMGEQGEPKEGIYVAPGDVMFNYVEMSGLYTQMTRMQRASLMAGEYGTHEHLMETNYAFMAQAIQNQLLYGRKGTDNTSDEGQIYYTDGLIAQCGTNVIDLGTFGNAFVFDTLSNFFDGLYESRNSTNQKVHACGEKQYRQFLDTARQTGKLAEETHYNADYGAYEFTLVTGGGKAVRVMNMRYAFEGQSSDWGITLDLGNVTTGEYADYGWKWFMDLDSGLRTINMKTDAFVGSICPIIIDRDTCGVIRGGTEATVSTNALGPITSL